MFARRIGTRATTLFGALGLLALPGCEFPSTAPTWTTNWEVQVDSSSLNVASFLPANLANSAADTTFIVTVPNPGAVSQTLGALCGASCSAVATIPIPAFNNAGAPVSGTFSLPSSVVSATLKGGSIDVTLTNGFSFDPLRPSGAGGPFGSIRLLVTSGGTTVADTTLSGAALILATGVPVTARIALRPVVVTGTLSYAVTVTCPGSASTATINPAAAFQVNPVVVPGSLKVRSASVTVTAQSFSDSSGAIDLSNTSLDVSQLKGAGLVLNVVNPLQVGGSLNLSLTAPGAPTVMKGFTLTAAPAPGVSSTSNIVVSYAAAEFAPFIGKTGVRIKLAGNVTGTGPGASVAITAGQKLLLRTNVRADINIIQP